MDLILLLTQDLPSHGCALGLLEPCHVAAYHRLREVSTVCRSSGRSWHLSSCQKPGGPTWTLQASLVCLAVAGSLLKLPYLWRNCAQPAWLRPVSLSGPQSGAAHLCNGIWDGPEQFSYYVSLECPRGCAGAAQSRTILDIHVCLWKRMCLSLVLLGVCCGCLSELCLVLLCCSFYLLCLSNTTASD